MVSGDMVSDSHFEFGGTKENGFGKVKIVSTYILPDMILWCFSMLSV